MAYIPPQIPSDISPGALRTVRFDGAPLFLWRKTEVSILVKRIMDSSEGSEGLDEVREIAARKFKESIITLLGHKNTIPPKEKILKIKECVDSILLFRHFLFPVIFFRIKDFAEREINTQDAEPLESILLQQEQMQHLILQYGHLSHLQERGDVIGSVQALLKSFKKLPKNTQPTPLIEALQNPETSQNAWKQIRFFYKALKKIGMETIPKILQDSSQ